ncbi:putative dehydrogenase [Arthrobacter sp. CAN_A214]|uniref:DUF6807 family protein n=1 Tax=Arthrobacter sp. CAN_A214 TaxID=2787720 RepID=UPI001A27D229
MMANGKVQDSSALLTEAVVSAPRIALVGVHGYGARHLANLQRLQLDGKVQLVAVADPNPPAPGALDPSVEVFGTLDELLAGGPAPDVVIIATPIHTHAGLGIAALSAGADVYLEKPATASLEQYRQLLDAATAANRSVQIGFQSLGSHALPAITRLLQDRTIGRIRGISATGMWVRDRTYFGRSRWAGKRTLDGIDVVDGVTTNSLAHAVATALRIAGAQGTDDVATVETDLYHAHDIEGDDTSTIRVRTSQGGTILCAFTLCAESQSEPFVTLHGTEGDAVFYYTSDVLEVITAAGVHQETFERTDLLENLLDHRSSGVPLLSSLAGSGAFMRVLEAIRTAEPPAAIGSANVTWTGEDGEARPIVNGIESLIRRATKAQATFSELGAAWARPIPPSAVLEVAGRAVAQRQAGDHVAPLSSPRPYLHPVTTPGGVVVTDHLPLDHVWHLGAGVALQDIDGINFWGGRTYLREAQGYVWREDHGSIRTAGLTRDASTLEEQLEWVGPDGRVLLTEDRRWTATGLSTTAWQLDLEFSLSPAGGRPVALGSPGSNGRIQEGYGGFFWRLPACSAVSVRTAHSSGEESVHGSTAPWLAWTADFEGRTATLIFIAGPDATDPWFVRHSGYPGVGLSLAWDSVVETRADMPLTRSVSVVVADGSLDDSEVSALVSAVEEAR